MLRPGSAGSNTAADHITVLGEAIAALPPKYRRRLMVTCDGAGASHDLIACLDKLASRPGHQLIYSVGWELGKREKNAITAVPEQAWQIAVDHHGEVRERRAPGAQLTLFEAEDGWRYCLWVTNLPERTSGWRGQPAYIDAAHRVHARVEDAIRTG